MNWYSIPSAGRRCPAISRHPESRSASSSLQATRGTMGRPRQGTVERRDGVVPIGVGPDFRVLIGKHVASTFPSRGRGRRVPDRAACSKSSNPTQPTTTAAASADAAAATASVTVPRPLSPAAGASIRNVDQPVTLIVGNAVLTQGAVATYTFEVSTDAAHRNRRRTRRAASRPGPSGQTSVTIDRIPAGTSYFWRARAEGGGTARAVQTRRARSQYGPAIVIDTATPGQPDRQREPRLRARPSP